MLLSKGFVKLRSLGLSPFVLALGLGVAGAAGTGCIIVEHGHESKPDEPGPDTIEQVAIDADQALAANPGEGVGVFVEYHSDGRWHVWTTCDTLTSKVGCFFQIVVETDPALLKSYTTDQLENNDSVTVLGDGQLELDANTDLDTDDLFLQTEPGSPLIVEAYLDGNSAQSFFYWVSGGVIRAGAPDNPVEFVPPAP